ncbi:hypothetical protein Mapa_000769 [Marchantia paleacea]|nr:hypothetical protein Mapa_000769 [Marchantia paleacea]
MFSASHGWEDESMRFQNLRSGMSVESVEATWQITQQSVGNPKAGQCWKCSKSCLADAKLLS